jgi:2,6-dihydroxypyridine 3-monooxygenase
MMAALALRGAGCSVDVYERVPHRLEAQGAGLRIVPEMADLLQRRAGIDLEAVCTRTQWFRHIGHDNRIVSDQVLPGLFTSWGSLHRALTSAFDASRYHLGHDCVGMAVQPDAANTQFANGETISANLAVFADGILSTGRRLLAPETPITYAGYVTWRGFVPASELSEEALGLFSDAVTYSVIDYSHMIVYAIPDPNRHKALLFNFVWYRNVKEGAALDDLMTDRSGVRRPISVPAGALQERYLQLIKADAQALLPPAAAEVVVKTREPFVQALYDVSVDHMAFGRACLVGDAAFVTRPHAGAATTKAAVNSWELADALVEHGGDVPRALEAWEPEQLALGRTFVERNRIMGDLSLVENRFDPLDPVIRPGLRGPQG